MVHQQKYFDFSMSLTLHIFLWTAGCITHKNQNFERQKFYYCHFSRKIYTGISKELFISELGEDGKKQEEDWSHSKKQSGIKTFSEKN